MIEPELFTWNPLEDINKFPLLKEEPIAEPLKKKFGIPSVPPWLNIEAEPILNPPIKPALAVIVPTNFAPLANNTPSLSILNLGPKET